MRRLLLFFSVVFLIFGCSTNNNGTVTVVPMAPTNLTGIVISTAQINLTWTDNATNEDGYKIERKTAGGNYAVVGSTASNMTTFNDMGLTPNTAYTYRVYAYNSAGNSLQYSNELTLITSGTPILTTTSVTSITAMSSVSGGEITSDGGSAVIARGVVWSTSNNPTVSLSTKTTDGTGTGIFTSNISVLDANTTYYVRAYATNASGTGYGNEISFSTSNIDITTGLIGFWPFNGNANDESGNGNNGTVNGATLTIDRFGSIEKAYSFDGVSDYINCGSNSILGTTNLSLMTISAWVYTEPNSNGNIVSKYFNLDASNSNYAINVNGTTIMITGNGTNSISSNNCLLANQWNHVVAILQPLANSSKIFINGLLINSGTLTLNNNIASTQFNIGRVEGPIPGYFSGKLDDIRIYNRALSASEVAYLAAH